LKEIREEEKRKIREGSPLKEEIFSLKITYLEASKRLGISERQLKRFACGETTTPDYLIRLLDLGALKKELNGVSSLYRSIRIWEERKGVKKNGRSS
jgi:hypothetical protein